MCNSGWSHLNIKHSIWISSTIFKKNYMFFNLINLFTYVPQAVNSGSCNSGIRKWGAVNGSTYMLLHHMTFMTTFFFKRRKEKNHHFGTPLLLLTLASSFEAVLHKYDTCFKREKYWFWAEPDRLFTFDLELLRTNRYCGRICHKQSN